MPHFIKLGFLNIHHLFSRSAQKEKIVDITLRPQLRNHNNNYNEHTHHTHS